MKPQPQVTQRLTKRYSEAFKLKVISEIESGKLTVSQAKARYDIRGASTIDTWLKKYGKNHLLAKIVRIEMPDETSRLKSLEKQKQELETALAQAHLKILRLESTVEVYEEHYGMDETTKKNLATPASTRVSRSSRKP